MTAVKSKALKPIDEVRNALTQMEPQFKMALPPQISVDKFNRVVQTALQVNPKLLDANRGSLYAACMKAAQEGLLPDGKEAALIPYGQAVQYIPMVYGILKKVRNSGELASMSPHVVYAKDEFEYWVDENGEHFKHRPAMGDRGNPVRVYAAAMTKDGFLYFEVMSVEEIEKVRSQSKSKDNGPWVTHWDEMARKTAIRRLSKRLPMSSDVERIIYSEDEPSEQQSKEEKDVSPKQKPAGRLNAIVEEKLSDANVDNSETDSDGDFT